MELISLTSNNFQNAIATAAQIIQKSGIIVVPTDTVYGIIANAKDENAVSKVYKIKQREINKPLPIFVKNLAMAKNLAKINPQIENFLEKSWPGKITVVLNKKPNQKIFGTDDLTIALRLPFHHFINSLSDTLNLPLTGTSANLSGQPASSKIDDIINQFQNKPYQPDLIINAGDLPASKPSTIIDYTRADPKIIRQ